MVADKLKVIVPLVLIAFVLASFSVLSATSQSKFAGNWITPQARYNNVGVHTTLISNWDITGTYNTSNLIHKLTGDFQTLSGNLNNDSLMDIVVGSGSYIQVYNFVHNQLTLISEYNLGANIKTQFDIVGYENSTASGLIVVQTDDNYIDIIALNGTTLQLVKKQATGGNYYGVRCIDKGFQGYSHSACAYVDDKYLVWYDIRKLTYTFKDMTSYGFKSNLFSNGNNYIRYTPVIDDINNDANLDVIMVYNNYSTSNDNQDGVLVFDLDANTLLWNYLMPNRCAITSVMTYNLDGGGDTEVIVSREGGGGLHKDFRIYAFKADGSIYNTAGFGMYDVDIGTNLVIGNFIPNNEGKYQICGGAYDIQTSNHYDSYIRCFDVETFNVEYTYHKTIDNYVGHSEYFMMPTNSRNPSVLVGARMNNDLQDSFVTSHGIFTLTQETDFTGTQYWVKQYNFTYGIYDYNNIDAVSLMDIDNDNNLDAVIIKSNNMYVYASKIPNHPPTIDNSYDFGGYGASYGFGVPVCVNNSVTFIAKDKNYYDNGNYINDYYVDRERIVTNCGQNSDGSVNYNYQTNLMNGSFDSGVPEFTCYFNQTGTYNIRLFLQDNMNTYDFSQFNTETITINVIQGESGVSCSYGSPVDTGNSKIFNSSISASAGLQEQEVKGLLNIMTGQNTFLKLLIAVGLIIAITLLLLEYHKSDLMIMLGVSLGAVISTALGLISTWVLLLLILIVISIKIFSSIIMRKTGE